MSKNTSRKAKPSVICGTDFSLTATDAADTAAAISRMMGIPLELVHAKIIRAYPPLDEELKAEADRLRSQQTDVQEHMVVGDGFADEELVRLVKRKACRLIVVASHGKRSPERWLLGKVSERTAERASSPTLVVRNSRPFLEWERDGRPLRIFVAYKRTTIAEAALRWAKELLAIGPCELTVGYAYYPPEERIRLGLKGTMPPYGNSPQLQAILERDISDSAAKILGTYEFKTAIQPFWADPEDTLVDMAGKSAADLLVVGSHQYHGFELVWHTSVSRELLHRAKMNVAVIPFATLRSKPSPVVPAVRKVLVTTDFSELANQAIPHAYSLLGNGGRVQLVHVIHPYELPEGEYLLKALDPNFKKQHAKLRKSRRKMLEACIPPDASSFGISTDIELVEHIDIAQAIGEAAERFGADAICIGSHGRTGLASAALGSTAMALLRLSGKPVYLVRPLAD
jgi:nucleotide-binding universal stress UspA family protein